MHVRAQIYVADHENYDGEEAPLLQEGFEIAEYIDRQSLLDGDLNIIQDSIHPQTGEPMVIVEGHEATVCAWVVAYHNMPHSYPVEFFASLEATA